MYFCNLLCFDSRCYYCKSLALPFAKMIGLYIANMIIVVLHNTALFLLTFFLKKRPKQMNNTF